MKKLLIILLLALLVSVLFTSAYQAQVSMPVSAEVTESPETALLGYAIAHAPTIEVCVPSTCRAFTLYNNFSATAVVDISAVSEPAGLSLTLPSLPITIPAHDHANVRVTYHAGQPGTYTVTYQVSADIDSSAHVELEFDTSVIGVSPPEETEGPGGA
jgi:hypothetical protein